MGWRDLISPEQERTLPWVGGNAVYGFSRIWTLTGRLPDEYGWYSFRVDGGRKATLSGPSNPDFQCLQGCKTHVGFLVGNRFIPDDAAVVADPAKLVDQTRPVYLYEEGMGAFPRIKVAEQADETLIFMGMEFPLGPEPDVEIAYQDRLPSVGAIPKVTPALDLAFRWVSYQREWAEKREQEIIRLRAEEQARREREERITQAMRDIGTGVGRRALAVEDFPAAARAALSLSGAELLVARPSRHRNQMVVQYRFRRQRFECEVERDTLRVVDAGICLNNYATGEKGDTLFTLESLPGVVGEAIDRDILVVFRHVR